MIIEREYAQKYFNKFVKNGNFDDWYKNVFQKYDLGEMLNFEAHHVIPINVLEKNPNLQQLLLKHMDDFNFNSLDNGIPLPKKASQYGVTGHSTHPHYDSEITELVENIMNNPRLNDNQKFEQIKDLISNTKQKLENDVLLGNQDINQLILK